MKINPIQTRVYKTIDGYTQVVDKKILSNGKEMRIYTEYKKGIKETSMQYLLDNMGNWLKSKLKYYDIKGKVIKVLKGERNV